MSSFISGYSQDSTLYEDWRWAHFTTENGLPSNRVYDVIETSNGIPWAVTSAGIAWYDGFKWNQMHDTSGIFSTRPYWIVPDSNGNLLVSGTGSYFDIVNEHRLRRVDVVTSIQGFTVHRIVQVGDKRYLILSSDSIYVYSSADTTLQPVPIPSKIVTVVDFYYTKAGGIWISTVQGLFRREDSQWILKLKGSYEVYKIKSLRENKDGSAFASITSPLTSKGLWEWWGDNVALYNEREGKEFIQTMDASPAGDVMAIYESGEIRICQATTWRSLHPIPSQLRHVLSITYRRNGDLWVGTESGLFLHKHTSDRWSYWKHPFPDAKNYICEIVRSHDSLIWLGTAEGIEIRKQDGKILKTIDQVDGKKLNVVTGLCEDNDGDIWISSGSAFKGAYRWNGKQWKYFGIHEGLDTVNFHKIRKDRQGRLWFNQISESTGSTTIAPMYQIGKGRYLGNHHPIGFDYIQAWNDDKGLRQADITLITPLTTIQDHLSGTDNTRMECPTCHSVHNKGNTGETLLWRSDQNSEFCLSCHDKGTYTAP